MIIFFLNTVVYPVIASAVFYTPPPLFTSRPLRPEELAQMVPHTTPKTWTIPVAPLSTAKMLPTYQQEFAGGLFHNSPPLYTSRPLRPEELAQMVPHTTSKTWTNPFATFEDNYQKQIRKKFTGEIFHTSPPLYTSRPLRPEELIQMVPHKNPNTLTTPFVGLTTTTKTVETYHEESVEFSTAIFDQPDEETDELYSPTLWSFGTFMRRNHTPAIEHQASNAYVFQSTTDHANQFKLTESEIYLAEDHTSGTNLVTPKPPESNLQKVFVDEVARPELDDFVGKYHTNATKSSISEISNSESEREFVYQSTPIDSVPHVNKYYLFEKNQSLPESSPTKLQEGVVNQFGLLKPNNSIRDYTSVTNPTIIKTTTPAEFLTSDTSDSEYQREFMNHIGADEPVTESSNLMSQKEFLNQFSSTQRTSFSRRKEAPISKTSIFKYQSEVLEQLNPAEFVTQAEEGGTVERNPPLLKSTIARSQKESTSQLSSNSTNFVGKDYATKLPNPETSTLSYAEIYYTLGKNAPISKAPTYKLQNISLNQFNSSEAKESRETPTITSSTSKYRRGFMNQTSSTKSDIYIDEDHTFETIPVTKFSASKPQEELVNQFGASQPLSSKRYYTKAPFPRTSTSKYQSEFSKQFNPTEALTHADGGETLETNPPVPERFTLAYQTKPMNLIHPTESDTYVNIYHTLGTKEPLSKYSTSKPQKESLNELISLESNSSFDTDQRESTEKPVITSDPYFGRNHTLGKKRPFLKSSTPMAYEGKTKAPFPETYTSKDKKELMNQFNPTESGSYATFEAKPSISQLSTANIRKEFVNKVFSSKYYTSATNPSVVQNATYNRRILKQPAPKTSILSPQMGFINHTEHVVPKNGSNVLSEGILEPMSSGNYSLGLDHFRVTDRPTELSTNQTQASVNKAVPTELKSQTIKQQIGTMLIKEPGNLAAISRVNSTLEATTDHLHPSRSKKGKIKNKNRATTRSPATLPVKGSGNLATVSLENSGNLVAFAGLQTTNQSAQSEIVSQSHSTDAEEDQTEIKNDGDLLFKKFGNWTFAPTEITNQPILESSTANSRTEFVNQLHVSEAQNEGRRTNTKKIEHGAGAILVEAVDNSIAYSQPKPTETLVAQPAQTQLADTGHIMEIYNQPTHNRVVNIPRIVSNIEQHTLHQGEYRIYNTATTTAPPDYESTKSNIGDAPWHAVQSTSYTVPQQNLPTHPVSNGGISWLVPQTTYNVPAPGYSWRLSGANEKLSNFDNHAGNFEVSSARNEIKLIYRPNVPVEAAPKSGSTHYETVDNPDGGKTHKLVLYV